MLWFQNTMYVPIFIGIGAVVFLLLIFLRWFKIRRDGKKLTEAELTIGSDGKTIVMQHLNPNELDDCFDVEQTDSLDGHLDVLTKQLAEKEGRLRLSKSKIRETQNEIDNLHALDADVRFKYKEVMDSLKTDLYGNEKECKKLQEQIEWVSRRRAELKDEVRRGQRLYGVAAAELADNLAELQRGRTDSTVVEKPLQSNSSLRYRKEPLLPRATANIPLIKSTSPSQSNSPPLMNIYDHVL